MQLTWDNMEVRDMCSRPSMYTVPPSPWSQPAVGHAHLQDFFSEKKKKLCISVPVQFKPMLFRVNCN